MVLDVPQVPKVPFQMTYWLRCVVHNIAKGVSNRKGRGVGNTEHSLDQQNVTNRTYDASGLQTGFQRCWLFGLRLPCVRRIWRPPRI